MPIVIVAGDERRAGVDAALRDKGIGQPGPQTLGKDQTPAEPRTFPEARFNGHNWRAFQNASRSGSAKLARGYLGYDWRW